MFAKKHVAGYIPVTEGIARKTLVHGTHTLMTEFVLKMDAVLLVSPSGPRRDLWYRVRLWGFAHHLFDD